MKIEPVEKSSKPQTMEIQEYVTSLNPLTPEEASSENDALQYCVLNRYLTKYSSQYKTIILVDDRVYTGASMIVTISWVTGNFNPQKLLVGTNVISKEIVELIRKESYSGIIIESIMTPPITKFKSVGRSYRDFLPVPDEKVIVILQTR